MIPLSMISAIKVGRYRLAMACPKANNTTRTSNHRYGFMNRNNLIIRFRLHSNYRYIVFCQGNKGSNLSDVRLFATFLLSRNLLPNSHELFQSGEQSRAPLRAHSQEDCPDAPDKVLVRFNQSRAPGLGKDDEDLATILLIAAALDQPAFFQAIDRTHDRGRIDSQLPCNRTDGTGFVLLRSLNQPQHHILCRTEAMLVRMFEPGPQYFTQV